MTTDLYVTDEAAGERWRLMLGDSCERLAELDTASVDLSVCSPPFIVGCLVGGISTAAVYEHRESEAEEPSDRGDREPFTGHVPSAWASSSDKDGAS